jgi:predicted ATPase/DNA-binding CsgD family transcriptional regulator
MNNDQPDSSLFIEPLTEQETTVLHLLVEGLSNREIAERLFLSASTVKWYVRQLNSKLNTTNRDEIVAQAYALGLIRREAESAAPRHNLPVQTTPFIGRTEQLLDLKHLLEDERVRLLTILAPGGMGKTRLALQCARMQIPHYADGVYFVDLTPLGSLENQPDTESAEDAHPNGVDYVQNLIISAIAQAVGFQLQMGKRSQKQQLLDYLTHKQLLLLLDNFEHLLDGAMLVAELLQHAPQIKIMVTSRERLNLVDETLYMLPGMALPDSDDAVDSESVQLFMHVARRVQPDFTVNEANLDSIARICHLTEGMPLGLLLAASWLDVLSPAEIVAEIQANIDFLDTEMRDVPDRQRSIRAVFESSWERLTQPEQEVFMRLSVFRSGFTREAAETIAGASPRSLKKLVSKSLIIQSNNGLYRLHKLLGQYAADKLNQTPHAAAVQKQHCDYYARFANKWGHALREGQQLEGLQHLEHALENIYAAFYAAAQEGDAEAINDLIETWYFFDIRCLWQEGIDLFEIAASSINDPVICAKIAAQESMFTFRLGQAEKTWRLAQESYAVLKDADVGVELAVPLNTLGVMAFFYGDLDAAQRYLEEATALAERYNDPCRLAIELGNLSIIVENRGDLDQAYVYLERQLALATQIGDYMSIAMAYLNLADISIQMGKYVDADTYCEKCIEVSARIGQRQLATAAISQIGQIAYLQEHYDEAHKLLLRSLERNRRQGNVQHTVRNLGHLGNVATIQNELAQAADYFHEALTLVSKTGFIDDGLLILPNVAQFLAQRGEVARAVEIVGFVEVHEAARHDKRVEARALLDQFRRQLPAEIFEAAQSRGQKTDLTTLLTRLLPELV